MAGYPPFRWREAHETASLPLGGMMVSGPEPLLSEEGQVLGTLKNHFSSFPDGGYKIISVAEEETTMFLKLKVILKGHLHKEKKPAQITWYQVDKETDHGMLRVGGRAEAWLGVALG